MGVEPPFLYDRASNYTFGSPTDRGFNPKAVTQASWKPSPPRAKQNGPLINFNKHPDSYLIVPYGNLNVKPMSPNTKKKVKRARIAQLFLRSCSLLGALGALFCVIAIHKTSASVGWIIRLAPAVALCHAIYGIYHLCRSAKGRTPASTASYMLFAAMVDTGLIPFFVFAAMMARSDYTANAYGWTTLFNDTHTSYQVIFAFFILCSAQAGLLVVSLVLDVFLATIFRKIAKLPPDMNPLEPNLTSRNGAHKRNKSEMNHTERNMNGSALAFSKRESGIAGTKRVPFVHTRTDSGDSVTLYGDESARNSRIELRKELAENEKDPYRMSKASSRETLAPTRPSSAISPSQNARVAGAGLDHRPARSSGLAQSSSRPNSRPSSWLSYMDYEGVPTALSDTASEHLDNEVRPMSPVSALPSRDPSMDVAHAERENWYSGYARNSQTHLPFDRSHQNLASTNEHQSNAHLAVPANHLQQKKRSLEPLGMNPPTPTKVSQYQDENIATYPQGHPMHGYSTPDSDSRLALQDSNGNAQSRPRAGSRSSSFVGSGGKSRFYGKLRTSLGPSGLDQSKYPEVQTQTIDNSERTKTMDSVSESSGNIEIYHDGSDEEIDDQDSGNVVVYPTSNYQRRHWNGPRQVSNSTGYDLNGGYAGLGSEFGRGMGRRREVSGKVVEEGRSAGYGGVGMSETQDGGVVTGQAVRGGAAGWARFKGL